MIQIDRVTKSVDRKAVLKGLTLTIPSGSHCAILGGNGSGKSTLLRILTGLEQPDTGTVSFAGIPVHPNFPLSVKRQLGAYLDDRTLLEELSGLAYLQWVGQLYGVNQPKQKARHWLELLHFDDEQQLTTAILRDYSLGMRRKIAIASTLMHEPKYLILDEVFSSLDAATVSSLINFFVSGSLGMTLVVTSHLPEYVHRFCDQIVTLQDGQVGNQNPN